MRVLVTGGGGVLGSSVIPGLLAEGCEVVAPSRLELDLFDAAAIAAVLEGIDAVLHLATRIPHRARLSDPGAWDENDRLRAIASRLLVDGALAGAAAIYVQPTVTFLEPAVPVYLRSALAAEAEAARFAAAGRRGVVLRFGLLDGPGTGHDEPDPRFGSTLAVADAGRALALALRLPSGVYRVDRERTGSRPEIMG